MSEIIDKAMVLFLRHKGGETQNIFTAAAAALSAEQASYGCLVLFMHRKCI